MSIARRIAAELGAHLQEAHIARLYRDLHRTTAMLIESRGRSDAYRARLQWRAATLRAQITALGKQTRVRAGAGLGGPVSIAELATAEVTLYISLFLKATYDEMPAACPPLLGGRPRRRCTARAG